MSVIEAIKQDNKMAEIFDKALQKGMDITEAIKYTINKRIEQLKNNVFDRS